MKNRLHIGRSMDNDLVINDPSGKVSRHHATFEFINNRFFITDQDSENGTWINGLRSEPFKRFEVLRGDEIVIAGTIILSWERIDNCFLNDHKQGWTLIKNTGRKYFLPLLLTLGILLLGIFLWKANYSNESLSLVKNDPKAIVLICNAYYVRITTKNAENVYIGIRNNDYDISANKYDLDPIIGFGTGFSVSDNGKIITNRHVAYPWMRMSEILKDLPEISSISQDLIFLGAAGNSKNFINYYDDIDLKTIKRNFDGCELVAWHPNKEIDLALIQTKSKHLIEGCTFFNMKRIKNLGYNYKVGSKAFLLGYPAGLTGAITTQSNGNKKIELSVTEGIISKSSDIYQLQYSIPSGAGSSGSPVFDEHGDIIAVNFASRELNGGMMNYGIKAGFILDLLSK
jgi:hypothetical protein